MILRLPALICCKPLYILTYGQQSVLSATFSYNGCTADTFTINYEIYVHYFFSLSHVVFYSAKVDEVFVGMLENENIS